MQVLVATFWAELLDDIAFVDVGVLIVGDDVGADDAAGGDGYRVQRHSLGAFTFKPCLQIRRLRA